ncbi:PQQ-binding-like beta-propeller repeat protein [Micromonospora sp. NPDC000316]|uniref:outer membrane protein assembly factor BamB family protein n=1 Tax=Micromonospora sp. NPDC000316 TaxID=3364216 RepID=UPI0036BFD93F
MPSAAVIDLDATADPAPPGTRRWLPALVAVGVLAFAGGAEAAAPLKPSLVLPPDGTVDVRSDGHTVFVLAPSVVAAYEVPGGRQRWAVPVTGAAQLVAAERGRVVIAEAEPATLTALDAGTGVPVWQVGGYAPVLHGTAGADGVVVADLRGTRADRPDLAGIDIRTGTVRWTLPAAPGTTRAIDPVGSDAADLRVTIAELDAEGVLRVHRADTGALVRTVTLERPGKVDGFDVAADRVLAYRADQGELVGGAVFDLTTGRQLWQHPAEPDGVQLQWCGGLVCRTGADGVTALDPDTGGVRWRLAGWTALGPLGDGRMLATRSTPGGLVLDAATGRVDVRFDGWSVLGSTAAGDLLVTAARTPLIGALDPATGAVHVLGRAASPPTQCITTATLMACWSGRVSIWTPAA